MIHFKKPIQFSMKIITKCLILIIIGILSMANAQNETTNNGYITHEYLDIFLNEARKYLTFPLLLPRL